MPLGYLSLVLHAHLPFVRHPEQEEYLEERWLYEAVTETYLPIIHAFQSLVDQGIPFRLTMSLSPTLVSMLTDNLIQERYLRHINRLIELSEKESNRTSGTLFHDASLMYREQFRRSRDTFIKFDLNLVNAFKLFQDLGRLELITCAATHGYLPFMNRSSIRTQVKAAVDLHTRLFGSAPPGIWLPECAFVTGVDEILHEYGIKYFFLDSHGLLFASHRPRYGVYAPVYCPSGVAAFGRDPESSKQVWSSSEGYPGDYDYREYYRDIGHDLDFEYIRPYIHPDGLRINTGIKYHRITSPGNHKDPYVPATAENKAAIHAGNFMFNREHQAAHLSRLMDRVPIIIAPYDAELFGHWWYEGPLWLELLLKKIHFDQKAIALATPGDYLRIYKCNQVTVPCPSSWGLKGYNEMWLSAKNDWIYRHLHTAGDLMNRLAHKHTAASGLLERALNQAARELLLAQSSDWAFIMNTGTMVQYAVQRTKKHLHNFLRLHDQINSPDIDEPWLRELEERDNIFPDIDFRCYANAG